MKPWKLSDLKNVASGVKAVGLEPPEPTKKEPKKPKYGNKKIKYQGIMFDSKKELQRYKELVLMQHGGVISDLKLQVKFELIPKVKSNKKAGIKAIRAVNYIADFTYYQGGILIVEDVKGFDIGTQKFRLTPEFKIKSKLMLEKHGINIHLV
jgi:hypothetical protein